MKPEWRGDRTLVRGKQKKNFRLLTVYYEQGYSCPKGLQELFLFPFTYTSTCTILVVQLPPQCRVLCLFSVHLVLSFSPSGVSSFALLLGFCRGLENMCNLHEFQKSASEEVIAAIQIQTFRGGAFGAPSPLRSLASLN